MYKLNCNTQSKSQGLMRGLKGYKYIPYNWT